MLLVGIVLLVVLAAALLGGGAVLGASSDDGRPGGQGLLGGTGPALGVLAVIAVVVVVAVGGVAAFGIRGGGDGDEPTAGPPGAATTAGATPTRSIAAAAAPADMGGGEDARVAEGAEPEEAVPGDGPGGGAVPGAGPGGGAGAGAGPGGGAGAGAGPGAVLGPAVRLAVPDEGSFPSAERAADQLADGMVLRVTASGFFGNSSGRVSQCVRTEVGFTGCRNHFPVRFDDAGVARFQYLVAATVGDVGCGPGAGCVVAVRGEDSQVAVRATVFGAGVPEPGRVMVRPRTALTDGQVVTVTVEGFRPGTVLRIVECVPPAAPVADRCGAPGPEVPVTVGRDGRASTPFRVVAGPVGGGRHPCERGHVCGIAVAGEQALAGARVVPIAFSAGAGATYDAARLAGGLAVAALLAGLAAWLVRRTDWRAPSEAATPDMDAAPLGGA